MAVQLSEMETRQLAAALEAAEQKAQQHELEMQKLEQALQEMQARHSAYYGQSDMAVLQDQLTRADEERMKARAEKQRLLKTYESEMIAKREQLDQEWLFNHVPLDSKSRNYFLAKQQARRDNFRQHAIAQASTQ